jgi:type II secretory ATPase GspE/PulE/Tfp pilus assembly ATPase PilB-like protein
MANPLDHDAVKKACFTSGLRAEAAVAGLSDVRAAIQHLKRSVHHLTLSPSPGDDPLPTGSETMGDVDPHYDGNSPVVKMATLLIERGVAAGASDIHLEPTSDGLVVRYRVDGMLQEATRLSPAVRGPLTARMKVMAKLDIAERRVPQDGRIGVNVEGRRIDCRVSTLPTQYGEKVVLRLLDPEQAILDLDRLGFEPRERRALDECLGRSEGLILTTGPTGSGKSTTLYATIRAIQSEELNIVTVENPIEYRLPGITQTQINERQGLSFAAALRSILRQDPDVILIGEIRDLETAEIAIQAAETGHLVLSTLHTNDSVGAITRLQQIGIERSLIASTLLMVIAQRLIRTTSGPAAEPRRDRSRLQTPFPTGKQPRKGLAVRIAVTPAFGDGWGSTKSSATRRKRNR